MVSYVRNPGFIIFGPGGFLNLHSINAINTVALSSDLRKLSVLYVLAIVFYQIFARVRLDNMTAAAAALLICSAVGGIEPQYLFWPLVFILASGRVRAGVTYALFASSLYFLFFLIPGASTTKGESSTAYLPLRHLSFLGIPRGALEWFANSHVALDIWDPLANLVLPVAMCCFGLYLLVSRATPRYAPEESHLQPLGLRAIRTGIPYSAVMALATVVYSVYTNVNLIAMYQALQAGVRKYAFVHPIFNTSYWIGAHYFIVQRPWNAFVPGAWWGSILIFGPLLIALWGILACRHFSNSDAIIIRDDHRPFSKSSRKLKIRAR